MAESGTDNGSHSYISNGLFITAILLTNRQREERIHCGRVALTDLYRGLETCEWERRGTAYIKLLAMAKMEDAAQLRSKLKVGLYIYM